MLDLPRNSTKNNHRLYAETTSSANKSQRERSLAAPHSPLSFSHNQSNKPQVLTRLLSEGRTRESTRRGAKPRGKNAIAITRGLPSARTASVLGWASALLDSHFTRLAMGGAADADLVGALTTLKEAVREEAQCCELLSQVGKGMAGKITWGEDWGRGESEEGRVHFSW